MQRLGGGGGGDDLLEAGGGAGRNARDADEGGRHGGEMGVCGHPTNETNAGLVPLPHCHGNYTIILLAALAHPASRVAGIDWPPIGRRAQRRP